MYTIRTYLKKTISEPEIRVMMSEQLERYRAKLGEALEEEEYGDAAYWKGLLRGLKLSLSMASCYFENLSSQQETDRKVIMLVREGSRC